MWGRLLLGILVLFGVWYYLNQKSAPPQKVSPAADEKAGVGLADCFLYADRANSSLAAAATVAGRPPVDSMEWGRVEGYTKTAISTAELVCTASPEVERALGLMRTSLSDLAGAARGEGGAMGVAGRQGEIDDLLNKARGR